jgi:hypothetical protein
MQQLYKCLGWQRLLWLNPCVGKCVNQDLYFAYTKTLIHAAYLAFSSLVESQKDFHVKRLTELGLLITTTTTTTQRTTTSTATTFRSTLRSLTTMKSTTTHAPIRIITTDNERLQTPIPPPPSDIVSFFIMIFVQRLIILTI